MELKNCRECGRAFVYNNVGQKKCPECREAEEKSFNKVKEFLGQYPGASIDKVHQETGVGKELIIRFVKNGRLLAEGLKVDMILECDRCGDIITEGNYCGRCQQLLLTELHKNTEQATDSKKGYIAKKTGQKKSADNLSKKMFIKDRIKKHRH